MRAGLALMVLGAAVAVGGAASAATRVEVRQAVARVTVLPEDRADVAVDLVRANPRLPLSITQVGDTVRVQGRVGGWGTNCHAWFGHPSVHVWGVGDVHWDDMPQIVVHAPRDVRVGAGGAVFGVVGRSASVDLAVSGCGDWTVADTAGKMRLGLAGSGDVRAGAAGTTEVHIAGSGDVFLRRVDGGLSTATSGSGDVNVGEVNGPLGVRISGSGDFRGRGGQVSGMDVSIAGSGDAIFQGVAQSLTAQVAGSGDVRVASVTGPVVRHVAGSGEVTVGR